MDVPLLYVILLYSCMLNKNSTSSIAEAFKLLPLYLYEWIDMLNDFLFCSGGVEWDSTYMISTVSRNILPILTNKA